MSRKRKTYHKPRATKSRQTFSNSFRLGTLNLMKTGRAFVNYAPTEKDIEVEIKNLKDAMHGDTVKVQLLFENASGRIKGKVVDVVERKQQFFLGTLESRSNRVFFNADTSYPLPVFIVDQQQSIQYDIADKVLAEWLHWDNTKFPKVKVVEVCKGWSKTKWMYHKLLYEHKFRVGFSKEVIQEVISIKLLEKDKSQTYRKDFRDVFTFTIDPDDAKDFDDAISFKLIGQDLYEVGVHIADVSHYVKPHTAIDKEAYKRATSVYMPAYVEPMLPEALSNGICSLVPQEDRLCFAAIFKLTSQGKIKDVYYKKTTICSNRRFTYNEVQHILTHKEGAYFPMLSILNTIAQGWRKERISNGSINFLSSDKVLKMNTKQEVVDVVIDETNESHQLIEEFMLLTNKQIAQFIDTKHRSISFPSRVHDIPDLEKVKHFATFAKIKGYTIREDIKLLPVDLNKLIASEQSKNKLSSVLPYLAIRCMSKALYSTNAIGHYGLAFDYYAHFTSPIRRYPDLMLHRILFDILCKNKTKTTLIDAQCNHCNERERAAMETERDAKKYRIVEFMQPHIGSTFDAIITGVSDRGIWAETTPYFAEGFIKIDELNRVEPFRCLPEIYCVKGMKSGRKLEVGGKITVKILAASTETRKIDFAWITKTTKDYTK